MNKKKILILTCSHGTGHKMVAKTLSDEFKNKGCEVYIHDLFDEICSPINRIAGKVYLLSYSIGRNSYKKMYYHIDHHPLGKGMHRFWFFTQKTLLHIIDKVKPDCIINVYPYTVSSMLQKKHYPDIPVFSVVTDFCVPAAWMHPSTCKYYVACQNVTQRLLTLGVNRNQIKETGIPIRNAFYQSASKERTALKYGLDAQKRTLLIFAGTYGVLNDLDKICLSVNTFNNLQTIVICGKNRKLYNTLRQLHLNNVHIMGFQPEINELYQFSDMMVTKPGGISLSEVVVSQIPIILYKPAPGQEEENARWFQKEGAAIVTSSKPELLLAINTLYQNEVKQQAMKKNLRKMYYGHAASLITDDILQVISPSSSSEQPNVSVSGIK